MFKFEFEFELCCSERDGAVIDDGDDNGNGNDDDDSGLTAAVHVVALVV